MTIETVPESVAPELTGGQVVVDALIAHGTTTVFGLPGIQLDPLFDALYYAQHQLELIVPRHEQATTYMADGYARATGQPAVAVVVPGPGVLNALTGLATAHACRTPVLLLAGHVASAHIDADHGILHDIRSQTGAEEAVADWVDRAHSADEIVELIDRAFAYLTGPNPGPVVIELPSDVLAGVVDGVKPSVAALTAAAQSRAPRKSVRAAAELLVGAERPMIVAGRGARSDDARTGLRKVAERLNAAVIVTESGKGTLAASHRLAFERNAFDVVRESADAVLVVGTRMRASSDGELIDLPETVVRIDLDPQRSGETTESGVALTGDAGPTLVALAAEIAALQASTPADGTAHGFRADEIDAFRVTVAERLELIRPQRDYLQVIDDALPDGGILVAEFTQLGYAAMISHPVEDPREFIWPGYEGTLGYGFATALGAAIGNAHPVICVTGDGGFSWTLQELSTAAKYAIPLVTIVVNDGYFGNVRRIQKEKFGGRYIAEKLQNPDYQLLAQAFGVRGFRVTDAESLRAALGKAMGIAGPSLIELQVGEFPSPWHIPLGE